MSQIFLSYSPQDERAASVIHAELRRDYGLNVWWDGDVAPGNDWLRFRPSDAGWWCCHPMSGDRPTFRSCPPRLLLAGCSCSTSLVASRWTLARRRALIKHMFEVRTRPVVFVGRLR